MSEERDYQPSDAFGLLRSYSRHLMFVRLALTTVQQALERRGLIHDASKMLDDEFSGFARINAAARVDKFGSPGYAEGMKRERPTIDLHFSRNTHHAEFYADHPEALANNRGAEGMTFLDIIEMVCDWWGAGKGYDDPRPWTESVALNLKQKGKYLSAEQIWLVHQVADFVGYYAPEDSPPCPAVQETDKMTLPEPK